MSIYKNICHCLYISRDAVTQTYLIVLAHVYYYYFYTCISASAGRLNLYVVPCVGR